MTHLKCTTTGARHNGNTLYDTGYELLPVELTDRMECMRKDYDLKMDGTSGSLANIEYLLLAILNINRMKHRMKTDNEQKQDQQRVAELEWRRVALVLDRFLFYLYVAILIGSLILFFPRRAYWYYWCQALREITYGIFNLYSCIFFAHDKAFLLINVIIWA